MYSIMISLLRVSTSESMIPRPCFQALKYRFLMLLLLVYLLVRLLQITNITCSTPYSTTLTIFSLNQCIYTISIVFGVLRTQEKHHNTTPPTVLLPLVLLTSFTKCFSGVVELTTQLLRLIGILWLPLCRINKLGYSYPRRLLRSPTLVVYHGSTKR